jgi:hypothetical protein
MCGRHTAAAWALAHSEKVVMELSTPWQRAPQLDKNHMEPPNDCKRF